VRAKERLELISPKNMIYIFQDVQLASCRTILKLLYLNFPPPLYSLPPITLPLLQVSGNKREYES